MAEPIASTLNYRRAVWLDDGRPRRIETLLRDALNSRRDVGSRRCQRPDGQTIECAHVSDRRGRMLVHIVAYQEGRPATLVGLDESASEAELREAPPPNDAAFMEGNLAALVCDNHVLFCGRPIREGALAQFSKWLFRETWPNDETIDKFELQKVANVQKLALIRREGVKSVRLHGCLKRENFARWDHLHGRGLKAWLVDVVGAAVGEEPQTLSEESIDVSLELDLKKRRMGPASEKWMLETAESLLEDSGTEFVIETLSGQRITNLELVLRKSAKLARHGASFDHEDAWNKLGDFLKSLREDGALEV